MVLKDRPLMAALQARRPREFVRPGNAIDAYRLFAADAKGLDWTDRRHDPRSSINPTSTGRSARRFHRRDTRAPPCAMGSPTSVAEGTSSTPTDPPNAHRLGRTRRCARAGCDLIESARNPL
uniref:Uncharacterized protein n=1 Tax=Phenylobacterium glaciei TaxID=2803784 RepID=A0A974P5L9_9CAUL|nr:hypothetical protein JKL49_11200 [Phenylobacterium glaciei]